MIGVHCDRKARTENWCMDDKKKQQQQQPQPTNKQKQNKTKKSFQY